MKIHGIFLSLACALTLSACETVKGSFRDMANLGDSISNVGSKDTGSASHVQMREDTGTMTPMIDTPQAQPMPASNYNQSYNAPQAPMPMGNNNVTIFDSEGYDQYSQGSNYTGATLPSYNGGMVSGHDSSVTVFSVDGEPMRGGQQQAGYYQAPVASSSYNGSHSPGGNQIYFKHGSSRLGSGDMRRLDSIANEAKFAPVNRVTVAGYASQPTQAGSNTVQGHILNLKESMNRSFAVSKTLMQKGVPAEKIKTVSWGSTKPTGNPDQDRRVDVIMGEQ